MKPIYEHIEIPNYSHITIGSYREPKLVEVPDWVEHDEGHDINAFSIDGYDIGVIAVKYMPRTSLGMGYVRIHLVDKDTNLPFPQMKGIWRECSGTMEGLKSLSSCKMDGTGKITNAFGVPDISDIIQTTILLIDMWETWRFFPKVTEYSTIKKLASAVIDVEAMQSEMENKGIEREINRIRETIKVEQDEISSLEKSLTNICEKAADAMNLLEENGVDINCPGMIESLSRPLSAGIRNQLSQLVKPWAAKDDDVWASSDYSPVSDISYINDNNTKMYTTSSISTLNVASNSGDSECCSDVSYKTA